MLARTWLRRRWVPSLVVVAAISVVGCGDDEEDATPVATADQTVAAETSDAPTADTSAPAAASTSDSSTGSTTATSDSPTAPSDAAVKVMVIAPTETQVSDIPEAPAGVQAAGDAINARGGIGGRAVEVIYCNDRNDPNEAAACGRQAVEEEVAAVVGSYSLAGSARVLPLLEEAQIPYINPVVLGATDTSSPVSFLMTGDVIGNFVGCGYQLGQAGATTVKVIRLDVAAAAQAESFVQIGLGASGLELAGAVPVPPGTTDVNPFVASALSDGTDGLVLIDTIQSVQLYLNAMQQSGVDLEDVAVCTIYDALPETSVDDLGDAAEGVYVTSAFPPRERGVNPLMDQFLEEMDALGDEVPLNDHALNSWLGMQLLARVGEDLPTLDGPSLLSALNEVRELDFEGLIPAYSAEPASQFPGLERVFGSGVYLLRVEDGAHGLVQPDPIDAFNL